MAAKYTNIYSLDADFQQVPLVQNFWKFHNIVTEDELFKSVKKSKKKKCFK